MYTIKNIFNRYLRYCKINHYKLNVHADMLRTLVIIAIKVNRIPSKKIRRIKFKLTVFTFYSV